MTHPRSTDVDDPLKPERWWEVYDWCRDIQQLAQKVSERVDSFANAIPDQRSASALELGAVKSDGESEPPQIALLAVPPEGERPQDITGLRTEEFRQPNWDGYGAAPISETALAAAELFWRRFAFVPCSDGEVQIEVHSHECDLEISFDKDGKAYEGDLRFVGGAAEGAQGWQPILREQIEALKRYRTDAYMHHSDAGQTPDALMVGHRYGQWLSRNDVLALLADPPAREET